jgi:hypothetical protein
MDDDRLELGPRRPVPRWVSIAAAVALAVGVGAYLLVGHGRSPERKAAPEPTATAPASDTDPIPTPPPIACPATDAPVDANPVPVSAAVAVGLGNGPVLLALDRHDAGAARGPWTVAVRAAGGSLGRRGAVITFPVPAVGAGWEPVDVSGVPGRTLGNALVWPIGGAFARVRGDQPLTDLIRIAAETTVRDGRPIVDPLTGFATVSSLPYRAGDIYEARYAASTLGRPGNALGFIYSGLVRAGGFEDRLYEDGFTDTFTVHGHPAVLSQVLGGSATLAWEVAPGVIAFVGYSGPSPTSTTECALVTLARASRLVPRTGIPDAAQVVPDVNDFS